MDEKVAAALRNNLSCFTTKVVKTVDPAVNYLHNWHIDLIAEYLLACQRGDITRLIINIPPRFLKSISVSVAYPAWLLGQDPTRRIMSASYSQRLSEKHSMDCRLVVQSDWYQELFPNTKLVDDQNTKGKFVTTERGFRIATSTGGLATGEGANTLIVDDPHNAEDAQSETLRNKTNTWFDQTFSTRLNDPKKGAIIVIMQRLHQDDLTGHLLKKGGWDHLCIPMIAEKDEVLEKGAIRVERKIDDLLHPERIGEKEIERAKIELGAYGFSGQMQQTPNPTGGGKLLAKWLNYYDKIDVSALNTYILIDPANSKRKKSDFTAALVLGVGSDRNLYIVDVIRDKLNLFERMELVFTLHRKYRPLAIKYQVYGMEADIQAIEAEMEKKNYRFSIEESRVKLEKNSRIERIIPDLINGKIYLPRTLYKANYEKKVVDVIDEFIHQEYIPWPVGRNDDLLDALAMYKDIDLDYPGESTFDYYDVYSKR